MFNKGFSSIAEVRRHAIRIEKINGYILWCTSFSSVIRFCDVFVLFLGTHTHTRAYVYIFGDQVDQQTDMKLTKIGFLLCDFVHPLPFFLSLSSLSLGFDMFNRINIYNEISNEISI